MSTSQNRPSTARPTEPTRKRMSIVEMGLLICPILTAFVFAIYVSNVLHWSPVGVVGIIVGGSAASVLVWFIGRSVRDSADKARTANRAGQRR